MLDVCVIGSVAPGAHIFMYFTEFATQGWVDALQEAITGDNDIAVISISCGNPEDDPQGAWIPAGVETVNQAFQAAIPAGVTNLLVTPPATMDRATGWRVARTSISRLQARMCWASRGRSSPLRAFLPQRSRRKSCGMRWPQGAGATGGGVSAVFTKPTWQDGVNVPPSVNPAMKLAEGLQAYCYPQRSDYGKRDQICLPRA